MVVKALDYFFAARPMLHIPIWSVYIYSYLLLTDFADKMDPPLDYWLKLLSLTLIAAGSYYLNQLHDQESDRVNQKLGFLQRGLCSSRGFKIAFWLCSIAGLSFAALVSWPILGFAAFLFLLGWSYSAPPLRLKDRPVLGLLTNALAFGAVVSLFSSDDPMGLQRWSDFRFPLYFFFAVASTHMLTTIPDMVGDSATGKKTVAVVLGQKGALWLALLFSLGAIGTAIWPVCNWALVTIGAVASLSTLLAIITDTSRSVLLAAKLPLFLLTAVASILNWCYFVFLVALVFATRIYYRRRFGITYPKLA